MTQHTEPDWSTFVREQVDARLHAFFETKREQTRRLSPRGVEMVDATAALTLRGGKRLRPLIGDNDEVGLKVDMYRNRLVMTGSYFNMEQENSFLKIINPDGSFDFTQATGLTTITME